MVCRLDGFQSPASRKTMQSDPASCVRCSWHREGLGGRIDGQTLGAMEFHENQNSDSLCGEQRLQ